MFDLGWPELLVIAIVLIVVVGPKDLPRMLRTFGRTTAKLRSMAGDFRKQFDEALKEAELDDVKTLASDMRKLDPRNEIKKHLSPLEKAGQDIRSGLDSAMKPQAAKAEAAEATNAAPAVEKAAKPAKADKPAKPAESASAKAPAAVKDKPAKAARSPGAKTAPARTTGNGAKTKSRARAKAKLPSGKATG